MTESITNINRTGAAVSVAGGGYVAYLADPMPVPGVYSSVEDALEAARAELPEGNAVGHVVEVGVPGSRRRRLYCLTASGVWREIFR